MDHLLEWPKQEEKQKEILSFFSSHPLLFDIGVFYVFNQPSSKPFLKADECVGLENKFNDFYRKFYGMLAIQVQRQQQQPSFQSQYMYVDKMLRN